MSLEIRIPDIGDFKNVPVIQIDVQPGQDVTEGQTVVTLESDKATLEVPAPQAGRILEIKLALGDKVSQGSLVGMMAVESAALSVAVPDTKPMPAPESQAGGSQAPGSQADDQVDLLVIGAGPGGYAAAFRAADLGRKVVLVDSRATLGGVCLNVGCIPSKALLHAAKLITETRDFASHGISFGAPQIDITALRQWKEGITSRLTGGLAALARQRKVKVITGTARFTGTHDVGITTASGEERLRFHQVVIATGSEPVMLPFLPKDDARVLDSTGALALTLIPSKLLIMGGGIIGLEMATVYAALGSRVTVVEAAGQLIPGADADLVRPLQKRLAASLDRIILNGRVQAVTPQATGLSVRIETAAGTEEAVFDQLLAATGRRPNAARLNLEAAGLAPGVDGFIPVDAQMRTSQPHIFAIGDIVGQPMLAHKATHQGHVAAEVACGHKVAFDVRVIPSVAYTDPEIAWCGLTETQAKQTGTAYEKAVFPWAASGRSLALGRDEGFTKLLFDPTTHRLLGAGLVGPGAGDLIAEAALAIEMGADARDIALTVHPHPTLSETLGLAAELFEGTITDLMPKT